MSYFMKSILDEEDIKIILGSLISDECNKLSNKECEKIESFINDELNLLIDKVYDYLKTFK